MFNKTVELEWKNRKKWHVATWRFLFIKLWIVRTEMYNP